MITARSRTRTWLVLARVNLPRLRHKIDRVFALSNCHSVNIQAETVAHRLSANRLRTGTG